MEWDLIAQCRHFSLPKEEMNIPCTTESVSFLWYKGQASMVLQLSYLLRMT